MNTKRRPQRRILSVATIGLVMAMATLTWHRIGYGEPPSPPPTPVKPLMRMKLDTTKSLLEAVTLQDFERAQASANRLRLLSLEAGWNVVQTSRYEFESEQFRRDADNIAAAAQRRDAKGMAVNYLALTIRCFECHDHIRSSSQQR